MENWQLTMIILASVLVGALVPLLIRMSVAVHRASKEITEIGAQLRRTLVKVEVISERVEVLSRGLDDGETSISDVLKSVEHIAGGLEQNMKTINVMSTIMATVGAAVGSFVKTRYAAEENGSQPPTEADRVPGNGAPLAVQPDATT